MNSHSAKINDQSNSGGITSRIIEIGLPAAITLFCELFVEVINFYFVGHLNNPVKIAAIGLGTMYINILCQSIFFGLNLTLETLVSQSYGTKNLRMCGQYLNKARMTVLILFIPLVITLMFSKQVFIILNQDPEVAKYAQEFIIWMIPGQLFYSQFDSNRQFLNSMGYTIVPMVISIISIAFHILQCHVFVVVLGFEIYGLAYATSFTYFLSFILLTLYTGLMSDIKEAWFFPNKQTFDGILEFALLGIPSIALQCFEWWSYEILILMSGLISVEAVAAQSIILNILYFLNVFPNGLQEAAAALVGMSIGAQDIWSAQNYGSISILIGCAVQTVLCLSVYSFSSQIAYVYTNQDEIDTLIIKILPILCIVFFLDATQVIQQGIIRGMGKIEIGATACFTAFYIIGIPLSYFFAFKLQLGVIGLWYGIIIGLFFLVVAYQYIVFYHFDWYKIAKEAHLREIVSSRSQYDNKRNNEKKNNFFLKEHLT